MRKDVLLITLASSMLLLSGCQHLKKNNADDMNGGSMGSVETGGMGEGQSGNYYLGSNYSTVAPANQQYYFEFDRSDIHPEYEPSIRAQAQYLASHPEAHIHLEGNTDARGSVEYNIALGERRAVSVLEMLLSSGAHQGQVSHVSFGSQRPVARGDSEDTFQLNRRVDLEYDRK